MALQGTLQDFGALEIFQLIALQQKTGTLEIRQNEQVRQFIFERGLLIAAHSPELDQDSPLVLFLQEADFIEKDDIPGWVNADTHQPVDVIDLATKLTKLDGDELVEAYEMYIQTILDEILNWPKGRFHFNSGQIGIPSKQIGPWKIESLLMESMRRLDELADLQAAELPLGMVPRSCGKRLKQSDSNRFYCAALALVDGKRSIHEIINQSALAGYDLCQALRVMRDQKIVEMTDWIPAGVWAEKLWKKRSLLKVVSHFMLTFAMLGLITYGTDFFFSRSSLPWPTSLQFSFLTNECQASRATHNVATVLESYRILHQKYPADYADLVEEGLLSSRQAIMYHDSGAVWELTPENGSYRWWRTDPVDEPVTQAQERD